MSEFTPARTETISAYRDYRAAHPEGNLLTFVENLRDTLATVRPNPDDARHVEVGVEVLRRELYLNANTARAVLTALAAMGGGR